VTKRGWLNESEFMSMVTMGQVLPGINIANFGVYVGQRKRGVLGSCICLFGLLTAPFFIIIGLAGVYAQVDSIAWIHDVLVGVAAAAVGLLASICVKSFRQSVKGVAHATLLFAIILAVGIFRVPMVPVVVIAAPLSVLLAWYLGRRNTNA
jgi:chromate transporter